MKSNVLFATVACAALAITAPALAKPGAGGGKGHGYGHANVHGPNGTITRGPRSDRGVLGAPRRVGGPNYGVNVCPPGLAAKLNGCRPPGQARKYAIGQRLPRGLGLYTPYNQIPLAYRNQIPSIYPDSAYDYIYRNNSIYVVDPASRLVTDIIGLAL
jgi:hypothetical protein